MKSLIAKFNDPYFNLKFHYALMIFFIFMIPISVTMLANSVPYLVALSIWALIAGHWAAAQGARGEISESSGLDNEDLDAKLDQILELLRDREQKTSIQDGNI